MLRAAGVLMPMALMVYLLLDARLDLSEHGGKWLPAMCRMHRMVMTHRTLQHLGKFSDQVGIIIELEVNAEYSRSGTSPQGNRTIQKHYR